MNKIPAFKIGDKVAYSVGFLDSTKLSHTNYALARGEITGFEKFHSMSLAKIKWNDSEIPDVVNVYNLAKVGPNPRFCKV